MNSWMSDVSLAIYPSQKSAVQKASEAQGNLMFARSNKTPPYGSLIDILSLPVKPALWRCCSLNLKTIAEGVEDEITLQHLRIHHCDEAQGYFFAKPMPAEVLSQYVSDRLKDRDPLTLAA
ncbi:MAG: hypothetical protein ACXU8A_02415 [Burkholderiaceae bacterium]